MPAGFADLLKGTGLLDGLAPAAAPRATSAPALSPTPAAPQSHASSSSSSWLPYAAGLAALLLGAWYFVGSSGSRQVAFPAAPKITVGSQDVGAQLGSVVEGLRGTLTGMKDDASAKAALPRLQETAKQLDTLNGLRGQLPAEAKKSLAGYAGSLIPLLRPLIDKALAASGVGPIAKPILDQILNRIEAMSKA